MSYKMCAFGFILAAGLSACATYQENPNYQYSSKYESDQATTQLATHATQSQTQAVVYAEANPEASDVIIASNPTEVSPYGEDVTVINPRAIAPSPTDQAYAGQDVIGTPGYGLYVPETESPAATSATASNGAQAVDYDYSENFVSADASVVTSQDVIRVPVAPSTSVPSFETNYIVRDGDTVYSMARRLCVGLDEIAGPNNLGQTYKINIGQSLFLPESRC